MALGFGASIRREIRQLASRKLYIVTMLAIPIFSALFFLSMLNEGMPVKVPTAVVDADDSSMSRQMTRSLSAMEVVEVEMRLSEFNDALYRLQKGEIYGFFYIPDGFEHDALSGKSPMLSYYSNLTYYIPGTLAFKGFKTIAVSTSGAIVRTSLVSAGADASQVGAMLQPVVVQDHPIHNPWTNYSIYLSNSFIPGVIALMVMLVTSFSVCAEIKNKTSIEWMQIARGSVFIALMGKLLPQTVIFALVGMFCQSMLYGYNHFPLNCNLVIMISAMILLVVACQSFALIICCIIPNLRLSVSIVSLLGVLSFSITGFSFPVESMYGAVGIFSYMFPLRYYFLIYVDQALNGIALFYSRWYFIALIIFPMIVPLMSWRLKRRLQKPVYVP